MNAIMPSAGLKVVVASGDIHPVVVVAVAIVVAVEGSAQHRSASRMTNVLVEDAVPRIIPLQDRTDVIPAHKRGEHHSIDSATTSARIETGRVCDQQVVV